MSAWNNWLKLLKGDPVEYEEAPKPLNTVEEIFKDRILGVTNDRNVQDMLMAILQSPADLRNVKKHKFTKLTELVHDLFEYKNRSYRDGHKKKL